MGIHVVDTLRAAHSGSGTYEYLSVIESGVTTANRIVGVIDLRHLGFGEYFIGIDVGVILLGEDPIGFLDFIVASVWRYS